ncbi:hypothetical protein MMC19_007567 [Ptychographa xylographoides]|nr:hypothetical protein [Ptychographa xylographoides]
MHSLLEFLSTQEEQFRKPRLASLYSDFRLQRATNPHGYAANLSAWETGLAHAAWAGLLPGGHDTLLLTTGEALLRALETKEWGRPLALAPVIDEAISQGRMISVESFIKSPTSIYHRSWFILPWRLLSWSTYRIGLESPFSTSGTLQNERYVLVKNVEKAAVKVKAAIACHQSRVDRVLSIQEFRKEVEIALGITSGLTNDDFRILLVHLSRDMKCLSYDSQVVKIGYGGDNVVSEITQEDINIVSLKSLIANLSKQLEVLSPKINELDQKARAAVSNKNRVVAMASLRSKKLYETVFFRRSETLAQLEAVYRKIEEAVDQVEAIRVMQTSSQVLQALNSEVGGTERVEDVLEDLRRNMAQVNEVSDILNEAAQAGSVVDESNIDDELEALEREDQAKSHRTSATETKEKLEHLERTLTPSSDHITAKSEVRHEASSGQDAMNDSTRALKRLSLDMGDIGTVATSQEALNETEALTY